MADDDIWASGEDNDQVAYDQMIAQREWEKMNEVHGNEGYKDGIVAGKDVTIQEGFNKGYKEGVALGRQFGKLRGVTSTLLVYYTQVQKDLLDTTLLDQLTQLYNELSAIGVEDLYTKDYFREPVNEEEKKNDQCCGQGSCSSSEPAKGDQCCGGQGSCSSSESAKDGQTSAGCCKSQDSTSSSCRSNHPALKSVDPAAVIANYQKRVDQLVSQLPLSSSNIVV